VDLADVALQPGAESTRAPGAGIETTLSAADFKFTQSVIVPVRYKGRQVQDVAVTLKYRDENTASYDIRPDDRGTAHFADVPIDEKITILVAAGSQSAEFPRIVASDAPGAVGAISLPDTWAEVKTGSSEGGRQHPLVGRWQTQTNLDPQRYITTFNADGTGTIRRASDESVSGGPGPSPPSGAFLWHVKGGENRIVMGAREYTWSVSGKGKNEKLVLKDASGKAHILYRR
jgi:hypothetical protein